MTLLTLISTTLTRLDEDPAAPVYYTAADAIQALNWAQRLFVLLTLCLEDTATVTLAAATAWYRVRTQVTDWLLPLRLEYGGAQVRPARLSELDALDATWQTRPGSPSRYACLGLDLLAVTPQPGATASLTAIYAKGPARMSLDADVPEIPVAYQELLPGAAIGLLRLREGGQEMQKAQAGLAAFFDGARRLARYVRQRSLDLRYDRLPIELERIDLSRLLAISRKEQPWLTTSQSPPAPAQP
jgi:hypothetical protein